MITSLPVRKGERFKKGDLLYSLDCKNLAAERKSLMAERNIKQLAWQSNTELNRLNAIGSFEVQTARARLEKAEADIARLDVRMTDCSFKAPYDGRVEEVLLHVHETPKAGEPILKIISDGVLEIDLIVPSRWLRWLTPGQAFTFVIDETGRRYEGELIRIGASVDPVSQTIEVTGRLKGKLKGVLSGMSGSARFARPEG